MFVTLHYINSFVSVWRFDCLNAEGAEEGAAAEDGAHGRKQTKHDSHDSKFKELVETIFQHCNESLSHEMEDAYDVPKYPIQEHQQKLNLIRQMSKLVFVQATQK